MRNNDTAPNRGHACQEPSRKERQLIKEHTTKKNAIEHNNMEEEE